MAIEMVYDEAVQLTTLDLWEMVTGFIEDPGVYVGMVGIGNLDGSEEIHAAWQVSYGIDWALQIPTPGVEGTVPTLPADTGQSAIVLPPLVLATDQVGYMVIEQTGGSVREFRVVVNRIT